LKTRFDGEAAVRVSILMMGVGTMGAALSRSQVLTAIALLLAGAGWMLSMALFNISIQTSAPRWVAGRALAGFRSSNSAGLAIGAYLFGTLADHIGITQALTIAGIGMCLSPLAAFWL